MSIFNALLISYALTMSSDVAFSSRLGLCPSLFEQHAEINTTIIFKQRSGCGFEDLR